MAIELLVPAGLAPVADKRGARIFEGQATTGLRDAPGPIRRVACEPSEVVRVTWADGLELTWRAEDLVPKLSGSTGLEGSTGPAVAALPMRGAARGLIVDAIVKLVVGAVPSATAKVLAEQIDEAQSGLGFHQLPRKTITANEESAAGGRILLLLHGTFASTAMAFGELTRSSEWTHIEKAFPLVYGFDHPTLSKGPLDNALELVDQLPPGAQIEIVSHSRGGLVGDVLAAATHPDAVALAGVDKARPSGVEDVRRLREQFFDLAQQCSKRGLRVTGHVRVACPARGTTLASRRLDTWLDVTRNVAARVLGLRQDQLFERLGDLVTAVVAERAKPETMPGIWSMLPDGPFVRWLAGCRAADRLHVIAGVSSRETWLQQIVSIVGDAFFQGESDLVVDTAAMLGGATREVSTEPLVLRDGNGTRGVHHLGYFARADIRERIRAQLQSPPSEETGAVRGVSGAARVPAVVRGRALALPSLQASSTRPVVVLVPDVFASCLAEGDDDVWPVIPALAAGGLARMAIGGNLTARAVVAGPYARLVDFLVRPSPDTVEVVPFAWDWRRSVRDAAVLLEQKLADLLKLNRPIHLLAHGAGGLVARALLVWHPERWAALRKSGGRLVMLGTPQYGAHRMVRVLLGEDALPRMLESIELGPAPRGAAAELRAFPGLAELLPASPDGDPTVAPAFLDGGWPASTVPSHLAAAGEVRRELASALATDPGGMRCIVGHASATPANLPKDKAVDAPTGDGTVLWSHARLPAVPTYLARAVHGALADAPQLFAAITELLLTGETRRLGQLADRPVTGKARDTRGEVWHPDEADLVRAALAGASDEALWTLEVAVVHGDLALQSGAVLVGHTAGFGLRSAEPTLDLALGGALSERLQARRYPQAVGSVAVVPTQNRDIGDGNPLPSVAVVVGLGTEDDLSRTLLADAVAAGIVDVARPPSSSCFTSTAAGITLSAALPEVSPRSLTLDEAVNGVLEGVVRANRDLERQGLADRRVGGLTLVIPYGDDAAEALRIARRWLSSPGIVLELSEEVAVAPLLGKQLVGRAGGREAYAPQRPIRTSQSARFRRITASAVVTPPADPSAVVYTVPSEDSRAWRVEHEVTWQTLAEATSVLVERAELTRDRLIQIRDHALPLEVAQQFDTGFDVQIAVDRWTAAIPWEAFLSEGTDSTSILSGRISILRQYQDERPPSDRHVVANSAALLIGAPGPADQVLPSVEREISDVQRRLQDADFQVTMVDDKDVSRVREVLGRPYEVVHIAGHGIYTRGDLRRTGLLLAGGEVIGCLDLRHFIREPPALVFLNCCHLGRVGQEERRLSYGSLTADLATFLLEAGVKAVVAAGWAVRDAGAEAFARELYMNLFTGQNFRNAVAQARLAARQAAPDTPTWAAYQCYGDPDFVLPSAVGARNNVDAELLVHLARTEFVTPLEAEDALGQVLGRLELTPSDSLAHRRLIDASVRFVERLPSELRSDEVLRRRDVLSGRHPDRALATKPFVSPVAAGLGATLEASAPIVSEPRVILEAFDASPTSPTTGSGTVTGAVSPTEAARARAQAAFAELLDAWQTRAAEATTQPTEEYATGTDGPTFGPATPRENDAVGQIHQGPTSPFFANGFLVGPRTVMTTDYVATSLSAPGGTPASVRAGARVVFLHDGAAVEATIRAIRLRDEYLGVAVLEVDGADGIAPLTLSRLRPVVSAPVAALFRVRPNAVVASGFVTESTQAVDGRDFFAHSARTPQGAAGAPIFHVTTREVIGVEHSAFGTTGLAVPVWRVAEEHDLAAYGVLSDISLEKLLRELETLARFDEQAASSQMMAMVHGLRSTRYEAEPVATGEDRKWLADHARGTELLQALKARFPKLIDDPLAGAFGGHSKRGGFRVEARIERQGARAYWRVIGTVICTAKDAAGRAAPVLHLHPTFREHTAPLTWKDVGPERHAEFRFGARGAFTLGVEIPLADAATDASPGKSSMVEQRSPRATTAATRTSAGAILLELDLAECDGADEDFRTG